MTTQPNPVQLQVAHADALDQYGTTCAEYAINPSDENAEARRGAYAAVLKAAKHLAGVANQHPTGSTDINAIRARWSRLCGAHDGGLPQSCTCPGEDPRSVILELANELAQARADERERIA